MRYTFLFPLFFYNGNEFACKSLVLLNRSFGHHLDVFVFFDRRDKVLKVFLDIISLPGGLYMTAMPAKFFFFFYKSDRITFSGNGDSSFKTGNTASDHQGPLDNRYLP